MGYSIKYGSDVVYQPGSESRAVHSASLSMRTDEISQLTFTMPPTHPLYGSLALRSKTKPIVMAFDDVELFRGFVSRISLGTDLQKVVTCKSELAMLDEVHVRLTDVTGQTSDSTNNITAKDLFEAIITAYNGKVESGRRFTIGHNVGANDVGPVIYGNKHAISVNTSSPATALGVIKSSILQPYGCMLKTWTSSGTRYIGLYTAAPTTNSQVIRFGENVKSLQLDESDEELYTGCYPIGGSGTDYSGAANVATFHLMGDVVAGDDGAEFFIDASIDYDWEYGDDDLKIAVGDVFVIGGIGFQALGGYSYQSHEVMLSPVDHPEWCPWSPRDLSAGMNVYYKGHHPSVSDKHTTTLLDVPDGTYETNFKVAGSIVYDSVAVSSYGLRTFSFQEDIFYGPDLLSRTIELVRQKSTPTYTLTVDAVDAALYDSTKTHLVAAQRVRVVSDPHGVDLTMQVTQVDFDLDNPGATKYTLGDYRGSITRMVRGNADEIGAVRESLSAFKLDTIGRGDLAGVL